MPSHDPIPPCLPTIPSHHLSASIRYSLQQQSLTLFSQMCSCLRLPHSATPGSPVSKRASRLCLRIFQRLPVSFLHSLLPFGITEFVGVQKSLWLSSRISQHPSASPRRSPKAPDDNTGPVGVSRWTYNRRRRPEDIAPSLIASHIGVPGGFACPAGQFQAFCELKAGQTPEGPWESLLVTYGRPSVAARTAPQSM